MEEFAEEEEDDEDDVIKDLGRVDALDLERDKWPLPVSGVDDGDAADGDADKDKGGAAAADDDDGDEGNSW